MKILVFFLVFFSSFNLLANDVTVLNDEIKTLFGKLKPVLEKRITNELNAQIESTLLKNKDKDFKVLSASIQKNTILNYPLKFYKIDETGLTVGTPEENPWELTVHARVHYTGNHLNTKKTVKLRIKKLTFKLNLDWYIDANHKITIKRSYVTDQQLQLSVGSTNTLLSGALKVVKLVLSNKIDKTFNDTLKKGLVFVTEAFEYNEQLRRPTPYHLKHSVEPVSDKDLLQTVLNIENKIHEQNLVNGILVGSMFSEPDTSTWYEAYGPNGVGNKGQLVAMSEHGDSAIWTGHYLASQAFRYAVMKDKAALDSVNKALGGVENLLGVNGYTGLLSRAAAPRDSMLGKAIQTNTFYTTTTYRGQTWVNYHGNNNGISRDQYTGVIFGLSLAYDLVDNQLVKKRSANLIKIIMDYIIRNDWLVFEDRGDLTTARSVSGRTSFPTQWFMINYQRLNMLVIADHIHPGRYKRELEKYSTTSETAEFFLYLSSMDNHHAYYKFNLFNTNIYNYFRLETDPKRRRDMKSAYDMVNTHIGHHDNSYFSLIHYSFAPEEVSFEKRHRIKTNLYRSLQRSHRKVAIPGADFSNIEYITVPGRHTGDPDVKISKYPLDIRQRPSSGNFFWQRSPFDVAQPLKGGNIKQEIPGIDITLVYWMGRYYELF